MPNQLLNPHECIFIQSRATVNFNIVQEYAELMQAGTAFEPCKGFVDTDGRIYIFDGYHRGEAAKQTGKFIEVELADGTKDAAEWAALHANITHGLRRSRDDIERVVKAALKFPRAAEMSNVEIARHCGCDEKTVRKYRAELEASSELPKMDTRTVNRNGTSYEMKVKQVEIAMPDPKPERQDARAITQPRPLVVGQDDKPGKPTNLHCFKCHDQNTFLRLTAKGGLFCPNCYSEWKSTADFEIENHAALCAEAMAEPDDPASEVTHPPCEQCTSYSATLPCSAGFTYGQPCHHFEQRYDCPGGLVWKQSEYAATGCAGCENQVDCQHHQQTEPEKPEWEKDLEEFTEFCKDIQDEEDDLAPLPNPEPAPQTDLRQGFCPFCGKHVLLKHLFASPMTTQRPEDGYKIPIGICQTHAKHAHNHFEAR